MVKREGMENLLLKYYEGETTEDETALVEEPEVQEDNELNGDYDFYRPIIRLENYD